MNYIKHLNTIFDRLALDDRLNPSHMSLYLSLFQFWNRNHFRNPFHVSRSRVMQLSKISSTATYHKCIRNLEQYGYLKYQPSYNPFLGSQVTMQLNVPVPVQKTNGSENDLFKNQTVAVPDQNSYRSETVSINDPYIKLKHINKNIDRQKQKTTGLKNEQVKAPVPAAKKETKKGPGAAGRFSPPDPADIHNFFRQQQASQVEADKFYNYFQSNGWLVGGRTPMKDWKAAARNWILNAGNYARNTVTGLQPKQLHTPREKNYGEPL